MQRLTRRRTATPGEGGRIRSKLGTGLAAALAGAAALALAAAPASAQTLVQPLNPSANLTTGGGAIADFSYSASYAQLGRNIDVSVVGFAPYTAVTWSWRDAGTNGSWTTGSSSTAGGEWFAKITAIPRTECSHLLTIRASGLTGVVLANGSTDYTNPQPISTSTQIVENCGPSVWLTSTGIEGDGFTPGGDVNVQTFSQAGTMLTAQNTTATASFHTSCFLQPPLGRVCTTLPNVGGGQIDVTNALNTTDRCSVIETYKGIDLSTGLSDTESSVCFQ